MIRTVTPSSTKKNTSWFSRRELPCSDRITVPRRRPAVETTRKFRVFMCDSPRM